MKDRRAVGELSIEELEELLRVRKMEMRMARLRQLGKDVDVVARDPLTPQPVEPLKPALPVDHLRFQEVGATAQYRAREVDEAPIVKRPEWRKLTIRWDWVRDKSLLVTELALMAGLALVLLVSIDKMQEINRASTQAQQLPALTATPIIRVEILPTPVIQVVLLPSGHTPPDSPGGPAPEPIPEHLRNLVSEFTPQPLPTPGPEHAVRIQIPAIGVDAPVVEGDDWETLKKGAGHHIASANPGERGNAVISAHNDVFGEIFRELPDLDLGDEAFVHTASQVYRYVVTQKRIIEPTEVSVMQPTSSPVLTLISCYPYLIDTHRIVVILELKP